MSMSDAIDREHTLTMHRGDGARSVTLHLTCSCGWRGSEFSVLGLTTEAASRVMRAAVDDAWQHAFAANMPKG